ncbi:hypothetical protein ACFE04_008300 [Oxalis oulophora]
MDQEKIVQSSLLKHRSEKNGNHCAVVPPKEVYLKDIKNQIIAISVGTLHNLHAGMNLVYSNLIINEFDRNTISWFDDDGHPFGYPTKIYMGIHMDTQNSSIRSNVVLSV